jgi:uncharacterized protein (DUF4415 family)
VDISFDPAKNARNLDIHGISFDRVLDFVFERAVIVEDTRRERFDFMPRKSARTKRVEDPENPEWTPEDFRRARPAREVLVEQFGKKVAAKMLLPRGRPKSPAPRTSISLRLPQDVLARWKATGPGWQTRMVERLYRSK